MEWVLLMYLESTVLNHVRTTKRDPRNASTFGRWKLRSYFSPFVDQSSPNLSAHVQERLLFTMPFSDRRCVVPFRGYRDRVAKLSEIGPKFWCFGPPFFGEGGAKFLTQFYRFGSPSNMCQNLTTIDQATSEIRRWKKNKKKHQRHFRMAASSKADARL